MIKRGMSSAMARIGESLRSIKILKDLVDDINAETKESALKKFNAEEGTDLTMEQWGKLDSCLRNARKDVRDTIDTKNANRAAIEMQVALLAKAEISSGNLEPQPDGWLKYSAKGLGSVKILPKEYTVSINSEETMMAVIDSIVEQDALDCFTIKDGTIVLDPDAYLELNARVLENQKDCGVTKVTLLPGVRKLEDDEIEADCFKVTISGSRK